jgi:hypothetical protein
MTAQRELAMSVNRAAADALNGVHQCFCTLSTHVRLGTGAVGRRTTIKIVGTLRSIGPLNALAT